MGRGEGAGGGVLWVLFDVRGVVVVFGGGDCPGGWVRQGGEVESHLGGLWGNEARACHGVMLYFEFDVVSHSSSLVLVDRGTWLRELNPRRYGVQLEGSTAALQRNFKTCLNTSR